MEEEKEYITVLDAIMVLKKSSCDYNRLDTKKVAKLLYLTHYSAQQNAQHSAK